MTNGRCGSAAEERMVCRLTAGASGIRTGGPTLVFYGKRSKRDLVRIHLPPPVCLPEAQEFRTLVNFEPAAQLTEGKMKGEKRKPS